MILDTFLDAETTFPPFLVLGYSAYEIESTSHVCWHAAFQDAARSLFIPSSSRCRNCTLTVSFTVLFVRLAIESDYPFESTR